MQKKIPLFLMLIAAGVVYQKSWKAETSSVVAGIPTAEVREDRQTAAAPEASSEDIPALQHKNDEAPAGSTSSTAYTEEKETITKLSEQYPQTRSQLLKIVSQADEFKNRNVEAHTITEIRQTQLGALKVMALRALLEKETDTDVQKQDMGYVIQHAQDPTIVKIATAALESINEGRPFFKDILDGIDNLPLD